MEIKIPSNLFGIDGKKALEKILSEPDAPLQAEPQKAPPGTFGGEYSIIWDKIYGAAMDVLREDYAAGRIPGQPTYQLPGGKKVVRPLTMRETALARIENYETLKNPDGSQRTEEERLALFKTWSFTSTGIAYKKGTTKCKIIPVSEQLVSIDKNYNKSFLPADYDRLNNVETDTSGGKYNTLLTLDEVLNHKGWIESFEGDTKALGEYTILAFSLMGNPERAMGFWVVQKPNQDDLRALVLDSIDDNSDAYGYGYLYSDARFVRVDP